MIRIFRVLFLLLVLLTPLCIFACSLGGVNQTVTGFVQSSAVDDDDNPTDVYIFDGKTEYKIVKNKKHTELLDFVDHKISATGEVSDAEAGKKIITIDQYKLLD